MPSKSNLEEARAEAEVILKLSDTDISETFFREAMRRNLSKLVRHLDRLVSSGGSDRELGVKALNKLGFTAQG